MRLSKQKVFEAITSEITEKLKHGTIPWRKSWRIGLPKNFITSRLYGGINFIKLCLNDFPSPYYLTFLQCKTKGGLVNKGEKGNMVVYWDIKEVLNKYSNEDDCETKLVPIIKSSIVFNLSQTNLYRPNTHDRKIVECETLIENMETKPTIKFNTQKAYYSYLMDYISIPPIGSFTTVEEYYSTLMHELVHWTGHISRLNRIRNSSRTIFEDSFEELIAEIGSAYLCALTNISPKVIENQTAYINSWLKMSEQDNFVILKASVQAQKAVNFILSNKLITTNKEQLNETLH